MVKNNKCRVYLACTTGTPQSADIADYWFYVDDSNIPCFVDIDKKKPHTTAVPCCNVCRIQIMAKVNT